MLLFYEKLYRLVMVGLERLLFLCNTHGGSVKTDVIQMDSVLKSVRSRLPNVISQSEKHYNNTQSSHFKTIEETTPSISLVFIFKAPSI